MLVLFFACYIGFWFEGWQLTSFLGFPIQIDYFLSALSLGYFAKLALTKKSEWEIRDKYFLLPIAFFASAATLSLITPLRYGSFEMLFQGTKSLLHLFYSIFVAIVFIGQIKDLRLWFVFIRWYLLGSLFINFYAFYQLPARIFDLPLAYLTYNNIHFVEHGEATGVYQLVLSFENFYRATSIFSEPSTLGIYNSAIIMLSIVPILYGAKQWVLPFRLLKTITIVSVLGLALTFSMSGVICFLFVFTAYVAISYGKGLARILKYAFGAILVLGALDFIQMSFTDISLYSLFDQRISSILGIGGGRVDKIVGESLDVRKLSEETAFAVWTQNALTGIGVGCGGYSPLMKSWGLRFATTMYMQALFTTGIIGAIGFVLVLFMPIIRLYNEVKSNLLATRNQVPIIKLVNLLYLLHFCVVGLFAPMGLSLNNWLALTIGWSMYLLIINIRKIEKEYSPNTKALAF